METEALYVHVPVALKHALEDLVLSYRRQGRRPRTLREMVVKACDELLTREVARYTSVLDPEKDTPKETQRMEMQDTHADQIMRAVAALVIKGGHEVFSRAEIRTHLGIDADDWQRSYTPIFQGMRSDQPGGAPNVGTRYKGVFRQVAHGTHTLTPYGQLLLQDYVM